MTLDLPVEQKVVVAVYKPDAALTDDEDRQLRRLLFASFQLPRFLIRRHLKESPAHRWLIVSDTNEIIAHAAAHEKNIGTEAGDLQIGGIAEVCVAAKYRGRGMGKVLLAAIDEFLRARGIPFALLFGQPKVYASSGYVLIDNEMRAGNSLARHWNPFCGKPMVKCLGDSPWPRGEIDLRGPTF